MNIKLMIVFASISTFFMFITLFPTIGILFGLFIAYFYKQVCILSLLCFTYFIGKIVKYYYDNTNKSKLQGLSDDVSSTETIEYGEITDRFSYIRKDGKFDFTFRNVRDEDGRQIDRLKFMREKFFKD